MIEHWVNPNDFGNHLVKKDFDQIIFFFSSYLTMMMAAVQKSFWSLFSDAKNLLAFFSPLSFHSFKKVPFVHSRAFNHFQPSLVDRGQNLCLFLLQPYSAEILRDNFAFVIQSFHFFLKTP